MKNNAIVSLRLGELLSSTNEVTELSKAGINAHDREWDQTTL